MKNEFSTIIRDYNNLSTNKDSRRMKSSHEELLKKCLLLEYKYVQKFCPLDVYIIPEYSDLKSKNLNLYCSEWNGVLFVKEGAYKKGIFKFTINIPQTYPSKPPSVIFISKVIHPLIDGKSGILDIKEKFETWKPGKHLIINVIHFVKEIFCDPVYIQDYKKGNKGISNLILKEIEKYCDESFQTRFTTEENNLNTSIQFCQVNRPMRIFLDKISSLSKSKNNLTIGEKVSQMNQWFTESFLNIVKEDESEGEIEEKSESNKSS